jgi:hypothetical protein
MGFVAPGAYSQDRFQPGLRTENAMATSFDIDEKFDQTLGQLKQHLGAASKAEVLRKAVALLYVATKHQNDDGSVTIVQRTHQNTNEIKVILR